VVGVSQVLDILGMRCPVDVLNDGFVVLAAKALTYSGDGKMKD
jgi:hypothetical protein